MGYQIAFDLYDSATQQFLGRVLQALRVTAPLPGLLSLPSPASTPAEHAADNSRPDGQPPLTADQLVREGQEGGGGYSGMGYCGAGAGFCGRGEGCFCLPCQLSFR